MCPPPPATPDLPPEHGVRLTAEGAQFSVYAGHARAVEVCLFDTAADGAETERRVPLRHRAHGTWFDTVPGVGAGQRYAFRVDGDWDPDRSLLHNPAKLLLDPYARAIEGEVRLDPAVYGHHVGPDLRGDLWVRDDRDSAPHMPRCVIVEDEFDWGADEFPRRSLTESLIYEVHVKNATQLHPGVPEELRGTYAGLAHPAFVDHLLGLGVTAVELLPVHTFTHEPDLVLRGLTNHWGYNTLGFFAPHAAYASTADPQGALDEFKTMVKDLHAAGIEVLLDVVYNHTAENARDGMTLSWRGLDQRAYYRVDGRGRDIDVTGCGNTLDLTHPVVARMVLDSLRYWVQECHVDGFRFDLAVALGRGKDDGYDRDHPFLVALRTDPVLSRAKLVAEPWDLGIHGWRTGQFPPPVLGVERPLPRRDPDLLAARPRRLRVRRGRPRRPRAGDPPGGVAGPLRPPRPRHHRLGQLRHGPRRLHARRPDDLRHQAQRRQRPQRRRRLQRQPVVEPRRGGPHRRPATSPRRGAARSATCSARSCCRPACRCSTPATSWVAASAATTTPTPRTTRSAGCRGTSSRGRTTSSTTTRHLVRLRHEHPVLRQRAFFSGRQIHADGSTDLAWFAADGHPMGDRWDGPAAHVLQALYDGARLAQQSVLIVVNGSARPGRGHAADGARCDGLRAALGQRARIGPLPRPEPSTRAPRVAMGAASMRVWRSTAG